MNQEEIDDLFIHAVKNSKRFECELIDVSAFGCSAHVKNGVYNLDSNVSISQQMPCAYSMFVGGEYVGYTENKEVGELINSRISAWDEEKSARIKSKIFSI